MIAIVSVEKFPQTGLDVLADRITHKIMRLAEPRDRTRIGEAAFLHDDGRLDVPVGAAKKLVGRTLGPDELREALALLRKLPAKEIARGHDLEVWRVRALPAGIAILLEIQRALAVPLEVGRGGLREGLALELLDRLQAVQSGGGR